MLGEITQVLEQARERRELDQLLFAGESGKVKPPVPVEVA